MSKVKITIILMGAVLCCTLLHAQQNCFCYGRVALTPNNNCQFILTKEKLSPAVCPNSYVQVLDSNPLNRDTIDEPGTYIYEVRNNDGTLACSGEVYAYSQKAPVLDSVNFTRDTFLYTQLSIFRDNGDKTVGRVGTNETPFLLQFSGDGKVLSFVDDAVPNLGIPYFSADCKFSKCTLKLKFVDEIIFSTSCAQMQQSPVIATLKRTWTVEDCGGNTKSTEQYIYFRRPVAGDLLWNFNENKDRNLQLSYGECTLDPALIPIHILTPNIKYATFSFSSYDALKYTMTSNTQFDTVCNGAGLRASKTFTITDNCTNRVVETFNVSLSPNGDTSKWVSTPVEKKYLDLQQYCFTNIHRDNRSLIEAFEIEVNALCKPKIYQVLIQSLDINNFNEENWVEAQLYSNNSIYNLHAGKHRLLVSVIDSCNNIHLETIPFYVQFAPLDQVQMSCPVPPHVRLGKVGNTRYYRLPLSRITPVYQGNKCPSVVQALRRIIAPGCLDAFLKNLDYDLDNDGNVQEHFQRIETGSFQNHYYSPWMPFLDFYACDDLKSVHYELQSRFGNTPELSLSCSGIVRVADNLPITLRFGPPVLSAEKHICVPMLVDDFSGILGMEFFIKFDVTKLKFEKAIIGSVLKPAGEQFGYLEPIQSIYFGWIEHFFKPLSLPAGTKIFDLCFTPLRSTSAAKIWIDTLNRYEFVNFDEMPVGIITKPGSISTLNPGDLPRSIKNLASDSLEIQVDPKRNFPLIRVFPNPVVNQLFVVLPATVQPIGHLRLKNIYGQVVLEEKLESNESILNVRPLPPGIHFVEIQVGEKRWTERIMVLRP